MAIRILLDERSEIIATQQSDLRAKTERVMAALLGKTLKIAGGDWVIAQAEKVPTPTPVTHHLTDLDEVRRVCTQVFQLARLQDANAPPPACKAGPLAGIFASAPYLHNGSVPSLAALLLPSDQRPKTFAVGDVLFDPNNVGLGAPIKGGYGSIFSVTDAQGKVIAGNSHAGHDYPAQPLTDRERAQLIAYFKGL